MRLISINIVDIGAEAVDGDRVLIRSTMTRVSSTDPTRIITPAEITVSLVDGQATVELDPGPADIVFRCRNIKGGGPYRINVPEGTGTVHLADLLKQHYPYEQPVVNAAYQYFLDAAAAAAAARASETNADGSATDAASAASDAAASASTSAASASTSDEAAAVAAAALVAAKQAADGAAASEADAEEAAAAAIAAAWSFDGFTPAQVSDAALRAEDAAVRAENAAVVAFTEDPAGSGLYTFPTTAGA